MIVGIEADIQEEEIPRKIITQNKLNLEEEDIEVVKTWKGKEGNTAVIRVSKRAHLGTPPGASYLGTPPGAQ